MTPADRTKTLQDLDGQVWPEPAHSSHLVTTCHRLRRKPLDQFTPEDLRILIGQNISLDVLIPLAIERLEQDPLIAGDLYPGDLLATVTRVEPAFWERHPRYAEDVRHILHLAQSRLNDIDPEDQEMLAEILRASLFHPKG